MLVLGVDTSGRIGSVAIRRDDECLLERRLEEAGHARTLVLQVSEMFGQVNIPITDCGLVAVSIGPGSFTGLRVGVVFAKTFAYANSCDLVAVDTLACIAAASPAQFDSVYVVQDAQRGDLFVGHYTRDATSSFYPTRQGDIELHDAEQWFTARSPLDVVSGPALDKYGVPFAATCRMLPPEYRTAKASVVARLGRYQAESAGSDDMWSLEPFYFRKSAAEEKEK